MWMFAIGVVVGIVLTLLAVLLAGSLLCNQQKIENYGGTD